MTAVGDRGVEEAPLHAAAVYESEQSLRAKGAPFLRAGLDRGDVILAMVPPSVEEVLRSALGSGGDRVQWQKPGLSHRRLGEVFEEFRGFLAARHAAGESARLLTENDLDGGPDRLAAYLRFEAVSTEVFRPYGQPWVCLYDRRRHPDEMLAHVGEVHPEVMADGGWPLRSTSYIDPPVYLASHAGPLAPVPEPVELDIELTSAEELSALRHRLRTCAASEYMGPNDVDLMLVAVGEVVANALQHGRPPCRIRVWQSGWVVYVRVDDHGHGLGLATAGYRRPATPSTGGVGLWMARQLTDVVHTQASAAGTTVELQFR